MTSNHCVLLAGGMGTRLVKITGGVKPKALVEIGGIPFLHFKLMSLIQMGFESVDLLIGHNGEQIEQYVSGEKYPNLKIRCFRDGPILRGTAGAIACVLDNLPASFWVSYADSYVLADIKQASKKFRSKEESVMVVLRNQDQIETSNVSIDEVHEYVIDYVKNPSRGTFEWIDYGLMRLTKSAFLFVGRDRKVDLGEVIADQIRARRMRAFVTNETFWDIGTPERLNCTAQEFRRRGWI